MRHLSILCLFVFLMSPGYAQSGGMLSATRDRVNFSGLIVPSTGVLFGVAGEQGKLLGDAYYDTTFQAGNIRFYGRIGASDSLGGVPLRLNLLNQEVEVRAGANDIRAAKAPSVRQFVMNNRVGSVSQFVNVREFKGEADKLGGFFEQLVPGKLQLLQRHSITLQRANYNAALNVGTKDEELLKKREWYVARGAEATRFAGTRKALLELMADRQTEIEGYLKTRKPDLKKEADMAGVFVYYNSLLSTGH